ncbi:MAG TPA: hypothetical protein VGD56_09630, partial [Gemmatirosa sp.]
LSDLADAADGTFPTSTDPAFVPLAQQALFALDQSIWQFVLTRSFYINLMKPASAKDDIVASNDPNTPPTAWLQKFYAANPAYYATWTWFKGVVSAGWPKGWMLTEYCVGRKPSYPHNNTISADACKYLFIDSTDGTVINKNGLFARKAVFTDLGIRPNTYQIP